MKLLIPRQSSGMNVHVTCHNPLCLRHGLDLLATLVTCPSCGEALDRVPQERTR